MKLSILLQVIALTVLPSCAELRCAEHYHLVVSILGGVDVAALSITGAGIARVRAGTGEVLVSVQFSGAAANLDFCASARQVAGAQVEVCIVSHVPGQAEHLAGAVTSFRGSGNYCVILPAECVF